MFDRLSYGFNNIQKIGKRQYRIAKKKWKSQTEYRRYYLLLVIFSFLVFPLMVPVVIFSNEVPDILVGLIGATTIFIFHEYIKIQSLKLENNITKLKSYSWYPTVVLVVIDVLITAPMLPFNDFSQQYTGLLVYIIIFSIFMHGTSKLCYYLYGWSKLNEEDRQRIEEHSREKNEEYKKKFRKRTRWVNNNVYRGKLPEVPEEAYRPIDEFYERTTEILIVLKKLLLNYPALILLALSGLFLLAMIEIVATSLLNLFTHPESPLEMKVLIILPIGATLLLVLSNLYIWMKNGVRDVRN